MCRSPVTGVIIYDRTPSADEIRIPAVAAPALFEINFDEDLLVREVLEIKNSFIVYGLRLCSTVVFCLAWVIITAWISKYAAAISN
jgi:hypothetical protein